MHDGGNKADTQQMHAFHAAAEANAKARQTGLA